MSNRSLSSDRNVGLGRDAGMILEYACCDYSVIRQEKNHSASLHSADRRSLRSRRWGLRPQTPTHFYPGRYPKLVGKPPTFGRLSVEMLALLPGPDRSGQPVARNLRFGPHPARPHENCSSQTHMLCTCRAKIRYNSRPIHETKTTAHIDKKIGSRGPSIPGWSAICEMDPKGN